MKNKLHKKYRYQNSDYPTVARKKRVSLFVVITACLLVFSDIQVALSEELSIGVFPRRNTTNTMKMFTPLAKHLSTELKMGIKIQTAKNFDLFWNDVLAGKYDIVHYNQLHYILSKKKVGYQVFAKNEEFGKSMIAPAIVVRNDSNINSIKGLKGKTVIFGGGKLAMISFIGAHSILRESDLDGSDFRFMFSRNPPSATIATFYQKADAAGVADIALDVPAIRNRVNVGELKYLATGTAQPHIPWAFHPSLSATTRAKVVNAFLTLNKTPSGKYALKKAALTNILPATDEEYDISRKIYQNYIDKAK